MSAADTEQHSLPEVAGRVLRCTAAYDRWIAARNRLGEQAAALFQLYGTLTNLPDHEELGLDVLAHAAHVAHEGWRDAAADLPIGYELIVEIPAAAGGLPAQGLPGQRDGGRS